MAEIPEEPNALADDVGSPTVYEHAAPTIAAQPPPADELSVSQNSPPRWK